jgi:hypothetical protein
VVQTDKDGGYTKDEEIHGVDAGCSTVSASIQGECEICGIAVVNDVYGG